MATKKFLDEVGTGYLWGKIKDALDEKAAASRVTALEEKHASGKTVAQEVQDGITALNLATNYAAKSLVDTLIGSDTGKSARTIANEELAAQLIPSNAAEALDTLQEIAAWIQAHPGDASAMNATLTAIQTKLELGTHEVGGEQVQYATVKAYVEAMIATVQAASHSHTNKDALDGITATLISNWNAAYTDKHTHANSAILADISQSDIDAWDAAATASHTHTNALVLDAITSEKVSAWDAAAADTYVAITTTEIDNIINPSNGN